MKRNYTILASGILAMSIGLVSQAVTITATPGMDYKGSTIKVSGAANNVSVTINSYASPSTTVFSTNVTAVAAATGFFVKDLAADSVYDVIATDGSTTVTNRLYQGEAKCSVAAWFEESPDAASVGEWSTDRSSIIKDGRFVFTDDDDAVQLDVTSFEPNAKQSDRLAVIELDMTFAGALPNDDVPTMTDVQGAIRIVEDDDKYYFACYVNAAWQMSNEIEVELGADYVVRVTLDEMNGTVRYDAKKSDAAEFVNLYNGTSSSVTAKVAAISFAGEGTVGVIDGDSNIDSAEAWVCQAGSPVKKYKSINAAIDDGKTDVSLLWDASWAAPDTGDAYAISGDKKLMVLSGKIAAGTTLPAATTTLAGGLYTAESKTAYEGKVVSATHRWVSRYDDTYIWEVLAGSGSGTPADEKVYPVTDGSVGSQPINIAFSKSDLVAKKIVSDGASDGDIVTALNTNGANLNKTWENVVLGLSNTDASSVPFATPVQSADANTITFALGGVNVDAKSNANVVYTVYAKDEGGTYAPVADSTVSFNKTTAVALPGSGVKYYQLKVEAKGAH